MNVSFNRFYRFCYNNNKNKSKNYYYNSANTIARCFRSQTFSTSTVEKKNVLNARWLPPENTERIKNKKTFLTLGIETSCDDTGIALVDSNGKVLSEVRRSYWAMLREIYGGIMPDAAEKAHQENISSAIAECLEKAKVDIKDVDVVAVTRGPGIGVCLKVGLKEAFKITKQDPSKMLIGVHHLEAHLLTPRLTDNVPFPFINLLVSGGNCQLILCEDIGKYKILGKTEDDAPGEAFDKAARALGLSGGVDVELLARKATGRAGFPLPMLNRRDCNFSFSGLKTFVQGQIKRCGGLSVANESDKANIALAFQSAVITHLRLRLVRAITYCNFNVQKNQKIKSVVLSGGVAANESLRQSIQEHCAKKNVNVLCPPLEHCTDNGVMIAWAGIERIKSGTYKHLELSVESPVTPGFHTTWPLGPDISETVKEADVYVSLDDKFVSDFLANPKRKFEVHEAIKVG